MKYADKKIFEAMTDKQLAEVAKLIRIEQHRREHGRTWMASFQRVSQEMCEERKVAKAARAAAREAKK